MKLKGYRTILFNGLATVLPILELTELQDVLPEGWLPYYMLGVALANMYLRTVTNTSIGKKQ